jgi:hypothetical protein
MSLLALHEITLERDEHSDVFSAYITFFCAMEFLVFDAIFLCSANTQKFKMMEN